MDIFQAFLSGVVQGLTEFLPVSSSGHLVVLHHLFGVKEPQLVFDICLHIATLFAVLCYFRKDILQIFGSNRNLILPIIIATAVTGAIAIAFKKQFENSFGDYKSVGLQFIITAAILFITNIKIKRDARSHSSLSTHPSFIKSIIVGIAQAIAIIPAISRSATTICSSILCNIELKAAIRFSFLLSIPSILAAAIFEFKDMRAVSGLNVPATIVAMVTAFIIALITIKILIKLIEKAKLNYFAFYCLVLGILVMIF